MEIILLENIKNLGKIGDTVKVKKSLFKCTEDGCSYKTTNRGDLRSHNDAKHEGLVRYKCTLMNCSFGTIYENSLKLHLFVHSEDKPHKCENCVRAFTKVSYLKNTTSHALQLVI